MQRISARFYGKGPRGNTLWQKGLGKAGIVIVGKRGPGQSGGGGGGGLPAKVTYGRGIKDLREKMVNRPGTRQGEGKRVITKAGRNRVGLKMANCKRQLRYRA